MDKKMEKQPSLSDIPAESLGYAKRVMEKNIRALKCELPTLSPAFGMLKLQPVPVDMPISSDMKHLFYNPECVIRDIANVKSDILHVILHCLYGDMEAYQKETDRKRKKVISLVADQRVGKLCMDLGYSGVNGFELNKMQTIEPYATCFGNFNLSRKSVPILKSAGNMQKKIARDDHSIWEPKVLYTLVPGDDEDKDRKKDGQKGMTLKPEDAAGWEKLRESLSVDADGLADKLSERLKRDKKYGHAAGGSLQDVKDPGGETADYRNVLREFFSSHDTPKEDPDSIDPMLYSYGLKLYEDVPLVEPREEGETPDIKTLCVAIDTSGSCSGYVADQFFGELMSLLNESESLKLSGELLYMQCDTMIQKEMRMPLREAANCRDDFSKLYGFGGTSFIPVFDRISELKEKEGLQIDGLIYLTDGWGAFPLDPTPPDYPVIFVLNEPIDQYGGFIPDYITKCQMPIDDLYI